MQLNCGIVVLGVPKQSEEGEVHMEWGLGIGGVFFKAHDPTALAASHRKHLGVFVQPGQTYAALTWLSVNSQPLFHPDETTLCSRRSSNE